MKKLLLLFLLVQILMIGFFYLALPLRFVGAQEDVRLPNPIGANDPRILLSTILGNVVGIFTLLAIAFVLFNAFKMVVAVTDEQRTSARKGLSWSIGGYAMAVLAYVFVNGTAKFLGYIGAPSGDRLSNPVAEGTLEGVIRFVMLNFVGLIGFAAVLMVIYNGYQYIISRGNDEKMTKAKTGLTWSIMGFVIAVLAYAIISNVFNYLHN